MDLLSSIRKSGSRGGVNFSWDEVSTSQHRENYLGHSLMAPVGRWQKGRDLNWYAKGDDTDTKDGETAEQRKIRERKEEIKRIKEAEEDALSLALGLPVPDRSGGLGGQGTGSNNIAVGELKRVIKETEDGDEEIEEVGRGRGFGGFVGKTDGDAVVKEENVEGQQKGGLIGGRTRGNHEASKRTGSKERRHRRHRHRSRSGERRRHRSRSAERHRHRRGDDRRERSRSMDRERRDRRHRSRSPRDRRSGRDDREMRGEYRGTRDLDQKRHRSRSSLHHDRREGPGNGRTRHISRSPQPRGERDRR